MSDDYSQYDGNPVHDMWVDYTNDVNTGTDYSGENPDAEESEDEALE